MCVGWTFHICFVFYFIKHFNCCNLLVILWGELSANSFPTVLIFFQSKRLQPRQFLDILFNKIILQKSRRMRWIYLVISRIGIQVLFFFLMIYFGCQLSTKHAGNLCQSIVLLARSRGCFWPLCEVQNSLKLDLWRVKQW